MIMREPLQLHIRRATSPSKSALRIPTGMAAMSAHRCQIEVQETRCDSLRVDVKAPFGLRQKSRRWRRSQPLSTCLSAAAATTDGARLRNGEVHRLIVRHEFSGTAHVVELSAKTGGVVLPRSLATGAKSGCNLFPRSPRCSCLLDEFASQPVKLDLTRRDLLDRIDRVTRKGIGDNQTHTVRLT